jgi:hypothetical protein
MNDIQENDHRQQALYFRELVELKIACEYMRDYRDLIGKRISYFNALRAISSSSAIAAWAVVQAHPLIWGGIIAITQVADSLKDVFPFVSRHKALNACVASLDALFVECLHDWEGIFSGRFSNEEITEQRRKLMQLRLEIEQTNFPDGGLPKKRQLLLDAEIATASYIERLLGSGGDGHGEDL